MRFGDRTLPPFDGHTYEPLNAKYGHLRAFNPVVTLLIPTTLAERILCTATGSVTTA